MKKMLACLLAAALITASMSGCVNSVRKETIDELGSYQNGEFYEKQPQEIDDIIAEYTEKINNSSDEDEIQNLKDECIEKINLVTVKAEADEFFASVKGLIMPYDTALEYVKAKNKNLDALESASSAAEINSAIDELKVIVDGCTSTGTYEYNAGDNTFEITCEYAVNSSNIPTLTLKFSEKLTDIFTGQKHFQISIASYASSSLENLSVERMLSWNAFSASAGKLHYSGEECNFVDTPETGRFTTIDEYTLSVEVMTTEQIEVLNSDSESYINSDGDEVIRAADDTDSSANFITIQTLGSDLEFESLMKSTAWVIIL